MIVGVRNVESPLLVDEGAVARIGAGVGPLAIDGSESVANSVEEMRNLPLRQFPVDQAALIARRILNSKPGTTTVDVAAFSSSI